MQERNLVERLKHHDEKALWELIQRYSAYVSTIVRNVGRDAFSESDTEEIVADVFLAVWNHAESIANGSLCGYLAIIARNTAINRLRQFHFTVPIDEITLPSHEDIASQTEHKLLLAEVRAIVERMKQEDREILLRFYFYYQHIPQIAEEMHYKQATVKTKLYRARQKLLEQLKERGYEYED